MKKNYKPTYIRFGTWILIINAQNTEPTYRVPEQWKEPKLPFLDFEAFLDGFIG